MKLSTRGRYGSRLLLDLAFHQEDGQILVRDVARRQKIPLAYLKKLIPPLVEGGIVQSTRGFKGGLSLAKTPKKIRLSEIIQLLEGTIVPMGCIDDPGICERSSFCATRDIWIKMQKAMNGVLEATTLQDLMERQREKYQSTSIFYSI
jgi:Rrf2 family protein